MSDPRISATDPYERRRLSVLDSEIAYVDTGSGSPVVFLHGNPTYSYLWRNVLPHLDGMARCLAPDLIGMGDSGTAPDGSYRFGDHVRYLDAWFDALGLDENVVLVGHDWGSALAFHWGHRHPERVAGLVYFEAVVTGRSWTEMPDATRDMFRAMRSKEGEEMILQKNFFIDKILPGRTMRALSEEEMAAYRRPYLESGARRQPMLVWPREIPIDGDPADVAAIVDSYAQWLTISEVPKLFINGDPGGVIIGPLRDFCRTFPNQEEVTVPGIHYLPEDSPAQIGKAVAAFVQRIHE